MENALLDTLRRAASTGYRLTRTSDLASEDDAVFATALAARDLASVRQVLTVVERELSARHPLGGTDPLVALIALRDDLEAQLRAIDETLPEGEFIAACTPYWDRQNEVEAEICEAVPTSIVGIRLLFSFLWEFLDERLESAFTDKIAANLLAGLEQLAEGGKA